MHSVCRPVAPIPLDERALEEQQLAYALAASRRETRGRPEPVDDDMARAIQASLQVRLLEHMR